MEGTDLCTFNTMTHMYHLSPRYLFGRRVLHDMNYYMLAGDCNGSMQYDHQLTLMQGGVAQELLSMLS